MHSYAFPGDLAPEIAAIGSQPIPYMRTQEFSDIVLESERILLKLIHCTGGRTIIYTGSGTGAMSAIVENYVSTFSKAFVIDGGSFGHRWASLCEYYGVPFAHFKQPFGKDIDYVALEESVASEKPGVLLCQHDETSSGVLFDVKLIGDICRRHGVSFVLDVISSFLAEPFSMDEVGADICVTSTQKGLNVPPGLSVLFFSKRLEGYKFTHRGYYWDFEDNFSNLKRGQTPFSPATIIFLQLHARLKQLEAEGGEAANIAAVHHRAEVFRAEVRKYGWEMPAESPTFAITAIQTKDGTERRIFRGLIEKYQTFIMPGGIPGHYRISHMGLQTDEELRELAARIKEFEPA
ncbi:MAG: alanine--glyoxylate aminotransferase family protein [Bacteroidales bacterium]|nr:alanine--glyoxylate aminotransferase family protein [Bacteroidales bacterium]